MAASMESLISDYIVGHDDSKAGEIARELFNKNVALVDIIEKMGEFLTNPEVEPRKRGTQLLAEIMQKIPCDFLSEKEVAHIVTFFISKLGDHHSVQPFALHGLAALTSFSGFRDANISQLICAEIFKEVQNQTLVQADRRATYTIFLNLLTLHLSDIQPMGDNFTCGYIQQMDGEKDPRNLMLAFRCSLLVCQNFPLGAMEEDMFEVNACYFPVDFIPPPNDPHGISREDLRDALNKVLAATPAFAQYCYPLLQEKLSSDVPSAKLDVLKAMIECLPVYEIRHLQTHLRPLCAEIIREVRACSSDELLAASLLSMSTIAAQLSYVSTQLQQFMVDVGLDLIQQVESDNLTLRLAATRILDAMAGANADVCCAVAAQLIPAVCKACEKISQLEQHTPFFTAVMSFLQHVADAQSSEHEWGFVEEWRKKLQDMCDRLMVSKDAQHQVLGVRGLCALTVWTKVFPNQEIAENIQKVVSKSLAASSDSFRDECKGALGKVMKLQPQLADSIISLLSAALNEGFQDSSNNAKQQIFENGAFLLPAATVDDRTSEQVCRVFLQILQAYNKGLEECLLPVSQNLTVVLAGGLVPPDFAVCFVIPSILSALHSKLAPWPDEEWRIHTIVLSKLVEGLRSLLLLLDSQTCDKAVSLIIRLVMQGEHGSGDSADVAPLKAYSQWQKSQLVQLLLAVTPCLNVSDGAVTTPLIQSLTEMSQQAEDAHAREQACKCVAAIINRMPAGPELDGTIADLSARLMSSLSVQDLNQQGKAMTLLIWLTKAMVVRGHKSSADLTAKLSGLLPIPTLGSIAGDGFHTIMAPCSDVLCPAVCAVVSPTFQQRFMVQNLPHLLSAFSIATGEVKENHMLAVAGMLSSVPHQVLVSELPQLMPILASSLKGRNSSLHIQALTTLQTGLMHSPDLMKTYLPDILPDCLELCTSGAVMKVRILALQCVGEMVHLPPVSLQPHKSKVVSALKAALDDHKRLVRKEAAVARSAWCLV